MERGNIVDIIDWVNDLPADYNDIDKLMYAGTKLGILNYDLSVKIAGYKVKSEFHNIRRRRVHAESIRAMRKADPKRPLADCNAQADINIAKDYGNHKHYEALFTGERIILNASQDVLQRINQWLSHLKEEKRTAGVNDPAA